MLQMTAKEMRSLLKYSGFYLFVGFLLAVTGFCFFEFGQFCGTMAMFLGACVVAFDDWDSARDRWRLTSVFLLFGLVAYVLFLIAQLQDFINPPNANPIALAIDIAIATAIAWKTLRFLSTITCVNWHLTRTKAPETSSSRAMWIRSAGTHPRFSGIPQSIYWRHS